MINESGLKQIAIPVDCFVREYNARSDAYVHQRPCTLLGWIGFDDNLKSHIYCPLRIVATYYYMGTYAVTSGGCGVCKPWPARQCYDRVTGQAFGTCGEGVPLSLSTSRVI